MTEEYDLQSFASEGKHSIEKKEVKKDNGTPEQKKITIDKRKLILYSEILKPKF